MPSAAAPSSCSCRPRPVRPPPPPPAPKVATPAADPDKGKPPPHNDTVDDLPDGKGREITFYTCTACHAADRKLVGPSWADIAKKHAGSTDYLAGKIKSGGTGVWGAIPMPPQTLPDADAKAIAAWLAAGAGKQ